MLDEGKLSDAGRIPYPDATFDVAFADNVMEHLADPMAVLGEVCRVLRPGGVFLFKTPNKTHYMPMIARITPHGFHRFVNRLRGRAEEDTFPTLGRLGYPLFVSVKEDVTHSTRILTDQVLAIQLVTVGTDRDEIDVHRSGNYGAGLGTRRSAGGRGGGLTGSAGRPAASHSDVITDATPEMAWLMRRSRIGRR